MNNHAWQNFLNGSETAFAELYRIHYQELFAYGVKIGFTEEACKDAIQDVFFHIYTSRKKLADVQNIEFYLIQSLRNKLFDIRNRETKINRITYDDMILQNEDTIVEQIIRKEKRLQMENIVAQSLKKLPPKQRKIIHFYYQLNLDYAEIATLLEMTPAAVKKSLYRGIQKLRETSAQLSRIILSFF